MDEVVVIVVDWLWAGLTEAMVDSGNTTADGLGMDRNCFALHSAEPILTADGRDAE